MSKIEIYLALEMGLIYGLVSLSLFLSFRILNYSDLTVDGSFLIGAAVSAVSLVAGFSPLMALALALFAGGIAGAITSFLYLGCQISALLSGIITTFMSYSICLRLMGDTPNISLLMTDTLFTHFSSLISLSWISTSIILITTALLKTDWGLALRTVGENSSLAQSYGIRTSLMLSTGLILSNSLIGLAGGLLSQFQGFSDISQGTGTIIFGLAGLVIGETFVSQKKMFWRCISCFLGSVLYRFLVACTLHTDSLGLKSSDLNLITGLALVFFMSWPVLKKNIKKKF